MKASPPATPNIIIIPECRILRHCRRSLMFWERQLYPQTQTYKSYVFCRKCPTYTTPRLINTVPAPERPRSVVVWFTLNRTIFTRPGAVSDLAMPGEGAAGAILRGGLCIYGYTRGCISGFLYIRYVCLLLG